ncbi:uncharacterized protein isoform X3 [Rhodnius prolixus]|uniref:uncharacterized protein isoform X3 n=1 Tax=Rhodnius prolixus TaxID=13249 RepID=UPI003D18D689
MLRLRNLIFFLYVLNVLFLTADLEVSTRRRNTSELLPNNAEGTGGDKKWINGRLKYTHTNTSFKTELQNSKPIKMKSHCKYEGKHKDVTVNSFVDKTYNASVRQPRENENLTEDFGSIQTNVNLNRKKSRHPKRYKNDNQRFSCQNIALHTNHNISRNNEDNFNKIKYIIGQDYDYNHALLDRLTSNRERKLPPNYKVSYNENFDPTIIYDGPSEIDAYYNTKRHLQHKVNQFEEYPSHFGFFNRKPANPSQMDKRYVHIINMPEDRNNVYNNNLSYSPNFSRHGALNWNQNSSNIRKINEIRLKAVKKVVDSSPVALQMKPEKTMSKIKNKSTLVQTTESLHKTNKLMEDSYSTNVTLRKSQYAAKLLSSDKIKENAGCCLATIETAATLSFTEL